MANRWSATSRRGERGATTVEYVGMVSFVALLVISLLVLTTPVAEKGKAVVDKAFCKIGSALGGGTGCNNADLPTYIPKECTISSRGKEYGGSISIIATVGGDTGYTIYRIRSRNDDGSYSDKYVVKTSGKVSGSYEFGPKAGAEVDTGDGKANAKGGASVTVSGDFSHGASYTFDNEEDAKKFADDNKAKFGIDGLVDGGPDADSTYYELGGKGEVSGEAGPLSGKGSGRAVLGYTSFKNGDKRFSLALTAAAAADLGLPLPAGLQAASASGDVSLTVKADVTFDKDGNLVGVTGTGSFTVQAEGGIKPGYKATESKGKHAAEPKNTITKLDMPFFANMQAGASGSFIFNTTLRNPDGTFNSQQSQALSDAFSSVVTGGGLDQSQKDAIYKQLNENSTVTAQINDYKKETEKYGGKVKLVVVTVGAEGHVVTTEEDVKNGWYYDPVLGTWEENLACKA